MADDGRAFALREEDRVELVSALKKMLRITDQLDAQLSTMASITAQTRTQSLHRLESNTKRSVASSPSVISSTSPPPVLPVTPIVSYRHSHQPGISSTVCSVPPPVPQIIVPAFPSSSTPSPHTASTFANSPLISNSPSVVVSTTEVLRTSITEPSPPLTRIENPHPHASPDFRFEEQTISTSRQKLPPPPLLKSRPQTPYHSSTDRLPSLSAASSSFSTSTAPSDFQIGKPQTVTNRPNYLLPLKKLNTIDLELEGEGDQMLIPLTESGSNEDEFPTDLFPKIEHRPLPVLDDEHLLLSTVSISNTRRLRESANSMGCQSNSAVLLENGAFPPLDGFSDIASDLVSEGKLLAPVQPEKTENIELRTSGKSTKYWSNNELSLLPPSGVHPLDVFGGDKKLRHAVEESTRPQLQPVQHLVNSALCSESKTEGLELAAIAANRVSPNESPGVALIPGIANASEINISAMDGGDSSQKISEEYPLPTVIDSSNERLASLHQIDNPENLKYQIISIIKDSLTKLEEEKPMEDETPIRWELASCWVQHLQKPGSSTDNNSKGAGIDPEPAVKCLGKEFKLLRKREKKPSSTCASACKDKSDYQAHCLNLGEAVPGDENISGINAGAELQKLLPEDAFLHLQESVTGLQLKPVDELVKMAHKYYEEVALPKLVTAFASLELSPVDGRTLTEFMRLRGLKMRSWGRMVELANKLPHIQSLCIHEMITRAFTHVVRAAIVSVDNVSDAPAAIASSLNFRFGRGSDTQLLPGNLRFKIAIGAARGFAFLHTLDGTYSAKISDFGLAKLSPSASPSSVSMRVMNTEGYAALEYVSTGHLYVKSDVYSFSVVLVESRGNEWNFDKCRRQWDPGKYCVALDPDALEFYLCV